MPLRAALRPAAVPQRTARAPLTLAPRPRPTPCGLAPHRFSLVPVRAAAEAEVADTGAKKATTDGEVAEGSISLAFKRVLVVVAQFLIGLLPGRMGLTWLAGLLPSSVKSVFMDLVDMYTDQMEKAVGDRRKAEEVTYGVFRLMCKAYAEQLFLPYNFPSYHRAIRSPTDYYKMGQQYIGCMIDFSRSILMYPDRCVCVPLLLKSFSCSCGYCAPGRRALSCMLNIPAGGPRSRLILIRAKTSSF